MSRCLSRTCLLLAVFAAFCAAAALHAQSDSARAALDKGAKATGLTGGQVLRKLSARADQNLSSSHIDRNSYLG